MGYTPYARFQPPSHIVILFLLLLVLKRTCIQLQLGVELRLRAGRKVRRCGVAFAGSRGRSAVAPLQWCFGGDDGRFAGKGLDGCLCRCFR
ncbi:hypothetical protein C8F01DRAFT_752549 [Mycena amicta]|nr:hypothetical protein C8F01DRAFT_752549 [Mycena amicta]